MKRLCAWCKREIGSTDSNGSDPHPDAATHGICPECIEKLTPDGGRSRAEVDEELGLVRYWVRGHITSTAMAARVAEVHDRADLGDSYRALVFVSDDASWPEMDRREMAQALRKDLPHGARKCAIVCGSPAQVIRAQDFATNHGPPRSSMRVFTDEEEATAWVLAGQP